MFVRKRDFLELEEKVKELEEKVSKLQNFKDNKEHAPQTKLNNL